MEKEIRFHRPLSQRGVLFVMPGERESALQRVGEPTRRSSSSPSTEIKNETSRQTEEQWGTLFRQFREARGLTLQYVADTLQMPRQTLWRLESKNSNPELETRLKVVVYLNTFPESVEREAIKNKFKTLRVFAPKKIRDIQVEPSAPVPKSELGDIVRALKKEKDLRFKDLAEILGLTIQGVQLLLSGKTQRPTQATLDNLDSLSDLFPESEHAQKIKQEVEKIKSLPFKREQSPTRAKRKAIQRRLDSLCEKHQLSHVDLAAVLGVTDEKFATWRDEGISFTSGEYKLINRLERMPKFVLFHKLYSPPEEKQPKEKRSSLSKQEGFALVAQIEQVMTKYGITAKKMASELGVSPPTLSKWRAHAICPFPDKYEKIIDVCEKLEQSRGK